jgi:chromosome segregation ATPase
MVTIDQVKQLETRVAKAIDYVNTVTNENTLLKTKLDSYQKRIDELEVLIKRFKEDQTLIEEGIIAALDRLNQFEDDMRKTITNGAPRAVPQYAATETLPADESSAECPPPLSSDEEHMNGNEDAYLQAHLSTETDTVAADGTEPDSELDIF